MPSFLLISKVRLLASKKPGFSITLFSGVQLPHNTMHRMAIHPFSKRFVNFPFSVIIHLQLNKYYFQILCYL